MAAVGAAAAAALVFARVVGPVVVAGVMKFVVVIAGGATWACSAGMNGERATRYK